jgi:hypothetical protein
MQGLVALFRAWEVGRTGMHDADARALFFGFHSCFSCTNLSRLAISGDL